jgi:hypothetical protein
VLQLSSRTLLCIRDDRGFSLLVMLDQRLT